MENPQADGDLALQVQQLLPENGAHGVEQEQDNAAAAGNDANPPAAADHQQNDNNNNAAAEAGDQMDNVIRRSAYPAG